MIGIKTPARLLAIGLGLVLVMAACSDDDGADVRDTSSDSDSESASAADSGSSAESGSSGEVACAPFGDPSTSDSDVLLELGEWFVDADPASGEAGIVTFLGENVGAEPHEFVISTASPEALPTDENGSVIEEEAEPTILGEVEAFPPQSSCDGTFALEPGTYTIFCNITEIEADGEVESHYAEGMVTTFEVS